MANPVLIAKLALVAADPKTWQKIIIACISIFIISAALLGSCGAMTFTDLGFDCSQLFSAKLNEFSFSSSLILRFCSFTNLQKEFGDLFFQKRQISITSPTSAALPINDPIPIN